MLLTIVWEWLREGRDEKGREELDTLMYEAVHPYDARRERAKRNLELLGKKNA